MTTAAAAATARAEDMAEGAGDDTSRPRRRRRTREDVSQRIKDAAARLFAERGYAATTTKEIARLADVSETLLFRYHGDKATLFSQVVTEPFQSLMDDFIARNPDPTAADFTRHATRPFTRRVYELFEENEALFRAVMAGPHAGTEEGRVNPLKGLDGFFHQSVDQVLRRYAKKGEKPSFDLSIGVRLGLGMIAASVVMRDSLFPDGDPDREALIGALEEIVERSLGGPRLD